MRVSLKTFSSEMQARLIQGLLKSNNIDSVISPGSGKGYAVRMDILTGIDNNYQLFVKDTDVENALAIIESIIPG